MQVFIKDLQVQMELKTNGIELEVRSPKGDHIGDLSIGKGTIEWCRGRTRRGGGVRVSWDDLIEFFENRE
jgi:hypothetical protein